MTSSRKFPRSKVCKMCKKRLPLTRRFFHMYGGFYVGQCNPCYSLSKKKYRKKGCMVQKKKRQEKRRLEQLIDKCLHAHPRTDRRREQLLRRADFYAGLLLRTPENKKLWQEA
jgi:hypothetical protein